MSARTTPPPSPDRALQILVGEGRFEDAARLFFDRQRYAEAGRLMVASLQASPSGLNRLHDHDRRLAALAATCFELGGEPVLAAGLLVALGRHEAAATALSRAGLPPWPGSPDGEGPPVDLRPHLAASGQLLRRLGRPEEAARHLAAAERHYEASLAHLEAGQRREALSALLRTPEGSPDYRDACVRAIAVAWELEQFDIVVGHFVSAFQSGAPRSRDEQEALYFLACLYERNGHAEQAREVFGRLLAASPGYLDAPQRLERLSSQADRSRRDAGRRILAEEAAFRGLRSRPGPAAPRSPTPVLSSWPGATAVLRGPSPAEPPAPIEPLERPTAAAGPFPFAPGSLIDERYRLGALLGRGGMSQVFEAVDLVLEQPVAVKVLVQPAEDPSAEQRFLQEMQLSRRLVHPNVVRLYELGCVQGFRYFTMELLRGQDLRTLMAGQPADPAQVLSWVAQACDGLAAAHAAGIVHRDVKPENLFVTEGGLLKLMDFGIARVGVGQRLTAAGLLLGTPLYMAPEQINSFGNAGPPADLYALGVVAFELLVGRPPFQGQEMMATLSQHLYEAPPDPCELRPDLPPAIGRLLLELLAKDPILRAGPASSVALRARDLALQLAC